MNIEELENTNHIVIDNIDKKATKLKFKTIEDIMSFKGKTKTEHSNIIIELVKNYIRAVGDDKIYYYNKNNKLWVEINRKQYETYIYDMLLKTVIKCRKIMNDINIDIKERGVYEKFFESTFDNRAYIDDIIKRSFTKLYNSNFLSILDSFKEYLPIKNGRKISLKSLEVSDRNYNDYFSYECQVEYLEETPNADKYFKQLFPDTSNREYVRKSLGYCFTGETDAQVFFVWYGFGSNSKGVLMNLIELILGKQYTTCDESIFVKNKKSQGQASPEIMALMGKRFGGFSEGETSDSTEMNESSLKRLSGEDTIVGRPLYCSQIEFKPYIKLNMATNYIPSLTAENAMKRRLRYIFFDTQFKHEPKKNECKIDNEFIDSLKKQYLSEVFSWIVKGSKNYYQDRKIIMPKAWEDRTNNLLLQGDSIECFIKRKLVNTDRYDETIKKNDLFEEYKSFCNKNSQKCIQRSTLWARMSQNGFSTRLLHGYDVYYGINIKHDEIETEDELEAQLKKLLN